MSLNDALLLDAMHARELCVEHQGGRAGDSWTHPAAQEVLDADVAFQVQEPQEGLLGVLMYPQQ